MASPARAAALGVLAGAGETAVMTASEYLEMGVTGRPASSAPGLTAARLLRRPDAAQYRLNPGMHVVNGITMGVLRAALGGLSPAKATAVHYVAVVSGDAVLLKVLGVADWPWRQPRRDVVVDVLHKAAYAGVTGLLFDRLRRRSASKRAGAARAAAAESSRVQDAPADRPLGDIEQVARITGPMPTGITVSRTGRRFLCYPKWGDDVRFTVGEIAGGQAVPYPDQPTNSPSSDADRNALVSVQSVVVDPVDRLWALDTGSPMFQKTQYGGPKLVRFDLATNTVAQTILFPPDVALPTTYLNDVRFDLRRGSAGMAFITDSSDQGANGLIVVDLATGESWRRLHDHLTTKAEQPPAVLPMVEGRPFLEHPASGSPQPVQMGADGIAIAADGSRLYDCPLIGRRVYSVSVDALADRTLDDDAVAATVVDEGDKGTGSDGLETDRDGRIYATGYEQNAVLRRLPDNSWETVAHDPRMLWPDTLSVAADGYLYFTANQLHRQDKYQQGQDVRRYPYSLFRVHIGSGPIELR